GGGAAYSRGGPSGRTVANPVSRRTRRCWDTAGCEMPNSARITPVIAPDDCSPAASSSRMRRRTGSPRTSNACTTATVSATTYISPDRLGGDRAQLAERLADELLEAAIGVRLVDPALERDPEDREPDLRGETPRRP